MIGLIVLLIGAIFSFVFIDEVEDKARTRFLKAGKWLLIGVSVFSFLSVLMPTQKDIAIILAGSWALNNEEMKKLPDSVIGVMNKYLEEAKK